MSIVENNLIEIIQKHSLTVRCLPHEDVSYWTYKEGDEKKKYVDERGNSRNDIREVVLNAEGKKVLKITKPVTHGGWWFVKPVRHWNSTVTFNIKTDKFFAPTLPEAIQLYLNSLNKSNETN